ncbi:MAG: hypothetical protein IKD94_03260 [Erysipelotrichaceae bacterium]|nr:hypothetical protein [Erysipelotrichaceae bacterium]
MRFEGKYRIDLSPEAQAEYNRLSRKICKDSGEKLKETNLFEYYDTARKKVRRSELEQFIVDCIDYKIIVKDTPANRKWFSHCFKGKLPVNLEDLTKQHVRQFRSEIKKRWKEEEYEDELRMQKYARGYSNRDVYNLCYEFPRTMSKILKDFKKKKCSYWPLDEDFHRISDERASEKEDVYVSRADQLLDRMIFLLNEMDEEKCSMKNIYRKEYRRMMDKHAKSQGFTDIYDYMMTDPANRNSDYNEEEKRIWENYLDYEHKIGKHREDCKNEFFDLFKEHFFDLWY